MEHHALKIVNNCNTKITFYLESCSGQSFNLYLDVVIISTLKSRHRWQLMTFDFSHRCLINAVRLGVNQQGTLTKGKA